MNTTSIIKKLNLVLFTGALSLLPASADQAEKGDTATTEKKAEDNNAHWQNDLKSVLETAREKKLPVLALFTGSDWCSPCIALEKKVLHKQAFLKNVEGKVLLVILDYPEKKEIISKELYKKNNEMRDAYRIGAYPTLLMLDHEGRPVGNAFSYPITIEAINKNVNALQDKSRLEIVT